MAFPSIGASTTSVQATDTTTHTVSLPSGISVGDLLIVQFVCDGNPTITWPAGWTSLVADTSNGTAVTIGLRYRIAVGDEGSTISITTSAAEESAHISMRITGHDATTPVLGAATAQDFGSTPDPPNSNPGVAADYLWIAGFGSDDDDDDAAYTSASYTGIAQVQSASTATSCLAAAEYRQLNASSTNPGVMNMLGEEEWVTFTFAVNPSGTPPPASGNCIWAVL